MIPKDADGMANSVDPDQSDLSHIMRKPVLAICEQHRHRSACASVPSDQRIYCSLPR